MNYYIKWNKYKDAYYEEINILLSKEYSIEKKAFLKAKNCFSIIYYLKKRSKYFLFLIFEEKSYREK